VWALIINKAFSSILCPKKSFNIKVVNMSKINVASSSYWSLYLMKTT
jgi:hypothetical protein